jgi:hypothetical protein
MAVRELAAHAVADRVRQGATSRVKALVMAVGVGFAASVMTYRLLRPKLDASAAEG